MEDRQTRLLKKLAKISGIDEAKLIDNFNKIDKEEPKDQPVEKTENVGADNQKEVEPTEQEKKVENVEPNEAKVEEQPKTENAELGKEIIATETPIDGLTKKISSLEEALKASEAKTAQLYEMFNKLDVGNKPTQPTDFDTRKLGGAPIEPRKGADNENDDDLVNKLGGYADR